MTLEESTFAPGRWLALLLGYFALQVVLRTLLSPSADLDESDQLMLCQQLGWGYGPQPPLYTWMQIGFFKVLGQSIFSLSLLKNLLLCSTYLLTYACARAITRSRLCGLAAALGLLLLPQVAWESQRDLTHSVLSATLAMGTLLCFVRTHQTRSTGWYVLLGVSAGLALISKYNCCLWVVGLALGALCLPQFRATLLNWRMLLALVLCVGIFLPNGLWMLHHRDLATLTADKFDIETAQPWLQVTARGLTQLVGAVGMFAGPLALIFGLLCAHRIAGERAERPGQEYAALLARTLLSIGGLLVLAVVVWRVTGFRDRWFQPVLICAPVLAVILCRNRLNRARLNVLIGIGFAIMAVVSVVMGARIVYAEKLNREEPLNRPYEVLAGQMRSELPADALLVADSRVLGGNLRLSFTDRRVILPELACLFPNREAHCILLWDATQRPLPPKPLQAWAASKVTLDWNQVQPRYFEAVYKYHHSRLLRLGMLQLY